jgi:hypothetical protein
VVVTSDLFGLGFVWRHGPIVAYLLAAAFSPFAMWWWIRLVEERHMYAREQPRSFILGNSAGLAPVIAATQTMVGGLPAGTAHWWASATWNVSCFAVAASIGPLHGAVEWFVTKAYGTKQMLSPAKLWHNAVVYAFLGYWLFAKTAPCLIASGDGFGGDHIPGWQFYFVVAAIGLFAFMVVYDSNPRHASEAHAHVPFDWKVFVRGGRQIYPEAKGVRRITWFPPRLAAPLLPVIFIVGYMLLRM